MNKGNRHSVLLREYYDNLDAIEMEQYAASMSGDDEVWLDLCLDHEFDAEDWLCCDDPMQDNYERDHRNAWMDTDDWYDCDLRDCFVQHQPTTREYYDDLWSRCGY